MSRKYESTEELTNTELSKRLSELSDAVTQGREAVEREFTMRVPPEHDRDADLVLAEAARRLGTADYVELEELSADHMRLEWLISHSALVSWTEDGELCWIKYWDDGEEFESMEYLNWREAIDDLSKWPTSKRLGPRNPNPPQPPPVRG